MERGGSWGVMGPLVCWAAFALAAPHAAFAQTPPSAPAAATADPAETPPTSLVFPDGGFPPTHPAPESDLPAGYPKGGPATPVTAPITASPATDYPSTYYPGRDVQDAPGAGDTYRPP